MGRAEAHRNDHKPTNLQVIVDAMNLHAHTCQIMSNTGVFNPAEDFSGMTLVHIFETTLEIYLRLEDSYRCVRACMEKGNSARLLRSMDDFVNELKKEIDNGKDKTI